MKYISLIFLTLFIGVSCAAQTLNLCTNAYTPHAPISISNTNNVVIRGDSINCNNGGTVGISLTNCVGVHIVRCKIINSTKQGILLTNCKNIEIDSCDIENVSDGIHHNCPVIASPNKTQSPFYAHHNYFKNINGPFPLGNAIQVNNISVGTGGGHVWIMYNSIENIDGQAQHPQDMISIYQSDGLVGDSIMVMYNYIRGGQIINDSGGAGGIILNDVGGHIQVARYNVLVNPGAVGIQVQSSYGSTVDHNKIFGDGHGAISFEGLQYGNYWSINGVKQPTYGIVEAYNQINWKQPNKNQFNLWFDAGSGVSAPSGWTTNTPVNVVDPTINANILPAQLLQTCSVPITPPNINYSPGTYVLITGSSITPIVPTNTGGASSSWTITPALPSGLSFSNTTGQITGNPNVVTSATNYLINATNAGGSSSQTISIQTRNPVVIAPSISYSPNTISQTVNTTITPLSASNTGGAVTTWSVSPAVPAGITFNSGTFSGTPSVIQTAQVYTVTASNSGGSSNAGVTITVLPVKPNISYAGTPYTFTQNSTIVPITPSNSGGSATYSISPTIPSGLSLNSSTGQLSGTPTGTQSATAYNITASNAGGNSIFPISIAINPPAVIPPNISYSPSSQTGTINVAITNMNPINVGGAATGYTISPALPTGLNFSLSNGVISGTATVTSGSTSYTIVGSNSGGSSTTHITLQINQIPAPSITYPYSSVVYIQGTPITPINPTNSGGIASSYSIVSGTLPAGILLDPVTGMVSGTPSTTQSPTNFTVQAANGGGNSQFTIQAAVNVPINRWWYIIDGKFGYISGQ